MTSPTTLSRLSARVFEDLWAELTDVPLEVTGRLPADLLGTLYRVVPTAFDWPKGSFQHWFDGHGQVHAIAIAEGGKVRYRNRFVRTAAYARSQRTGRPGANFGTRAEGLFSNMGGPDSTANTNVLKLGDRLLALQEGGRPHVLDPLTLETRGQEDLGFLAKNEGLSAHPHWDPGAKVSVAANLLYGRETAVRVRTFDHHGARGAAFDMPLPYAPVLIHDFGLSARHVAVPVFPQTVQPLKILAGLTSLAEGSRWEPEKGAFVLVADRDGGNVRRFELPAMFSFHVMNCFDAPDGVVLDMVTYASGEIVKAIGTLRATGSGALATGRLQRVRLLSNGRTEIEPLSPDMAEFPRLDPRRQGVAYRHGYFVTGRAGEPFAAIARLDGDTGDMTRWQAPAGHLVGEPVPVVKEGAGERDDAVWLLAVVYDPAIHRSRVVVLDGEAIEAGPVAEIHLPHHVPLGFHGNFHRS